jgi:hypothetical protein
MPKVTAAEFREKHAARLKAAMADVQRGVDRVSVAPGTQAAAKQAKMLTRLTEAVNSGKWSKRVSAIGLEEWKTLMKDKGIPRIASGIDAAGAKVEKFAGELLAFESTVQAKIDRMPDLSLEDSVNRASTWIREMSKFRTT